MQMKTERKWKYVICKINRGKWGQCEPAKQQIRANREFEEIISCEPEEEWQANLKRSVVNNWVGQVYSRPYEELSVSCSGRLTFTHFMAGPRTGIDRKSSMLLGVNRRFGRTYRLHLQGWRVKSVDYRRTTQASWNRHLFVTIGAAASNPRLSRQVNCEKGAWQRARMKWEMCITIHGNYYDDDI
jgi:hypothetical protein